MVFKKEYSPLDFMPIYGFFSFDLVEKVNRIWSSGHPGAADTGNTWFTWSCRNGQYSMGTATIANTMRLGEKKRGIFKGKKFCEFGNQEACYAHHCLCVCAGWYIRYVFWQSLTWGLIELKLRPKEFHLYIPTSLCFDKICIQLWVFYVFVAVISSMYIYTYFYLCIYTVF